MSTATPSRARRLRAWCVLALLGVITLGVAPHAVAGNSTPSRAAVGPYTVASCRGQGHDGEIDLDRFNLCALVDFTVVHTVNKRPDGSITGRITAVVTLHPKGSRDVEVLVGMDHLVPRGVLTSATPLNFELVCAGDGCSETTPVTRTLAQWETSTAHLVVHPPRGAGPDFITHGTLTLEASAIAAGTRTPPDKIALPGYRCDKATYLEKTEGCVFPREMPRITYSLTGASPASAQHIDRALTHPGDTVPPDPAKTIPAVLTRAKPLDPRPAFIRDTCARYFPAYALQNVFKVPLGQECDEYPFAASAQAPQQGTTNWSVEPVPGPDNQAAGQQLRAFYRDQRVLRGEKFTVVVGP